MHLIHDRLRPSLCPSGTLHLSTLLLTKHPAIRIIRAHSIYLLRSSYGYSPSRACQIVHQVQSPVIKDRIYYTATRAAHISARSRWPIVSSDADNDAALFEDLKRLSFEGKYAQVQTLVHRLVKDRGQKPNIRIYDALILANLDPRYGSPAEVAYLLQEMADEGIIPDAATYHSVLKVLAVHPDYLLRQHIVSQLRDRWFSLTKDGYHYITASLIRERQLELALESLEHMQREGIRIQAWLYDMMVYSLCSTGEFDEALDLMHRRLDAGELLISGGLWAFLLDTASRALHYSATAFAYDARVETNYLNPSSGMCWNILATATRHADTRLATSVLRILSKRSGKPVQQHHYEALLEAYVNANDLYTAFTLLSTMEDAGYNPTEASTRPIFTYLRQSSRLPVIALGVLRKLKQRDRRIPIQAVNVILEAHIYHNDLDSALELYEGMESLSISSRLLPNTATFNNLLRGCAKTARKDKAMFLASEMLALKILPDALTYDRLILVCLEISTDLEDAWRYFEEMTQAAWSPRPGTMMALARAACAVGDTRVWRLAGREQGKGLKKELLERLVEAHWFKEVQAGSHGLQTDGTNKLSKVHEFSEVGDGDMDTLMHDD